MAGLVRRPPLTLPAGIENVVFDLGGVLLTWDPDRIVAGLFAEPDVRASVKREVFLHPDWQALDSGTLTEEAARQRFIGRTGRTADEIDALMLRTMECLHPIPESMELLEELSAAGAGLYCLSNMRARSYRYVRERFEFLERFRGIVVSSDVALLKPERAIYEHLIARFRLVPKATVFVDDSLPNVDGARQAGLHAVHFRDAGDCRRQLEALL